MVGEGLCCGSIDPKNEKLWLAYKKKKHTQKKNRNGSFAATRRVTAVAVCRHGVTVRSGDGGGDGSGVVVLKPQESSEQTLKEQRKRRTEGEDTGFHSELH